MIRLPRIYDPPHGASGVLDAQFAFAQDAGRSFTYQALNAPRRADQPVAARSQTETRLDVGAGSFLTHFSAVSSQSAGFKFQILLAESGRTLFSQLVRHDLAAGAAIVSPLAGRLPRYLPALFVVPPPGQLLVRVVNLAAVSNDCELCLHFASPLAPYLEEAA